MKKLIVLGLGLLLTLNPIKINANQEYEEWQLELLEKATYYINDVFKNELLEIDGEWFLIENVTQVTFDGGENWTRYLDGYYLTISNSSNYDYPILFSHTFTYSQIESLGYPYVFWGGAYPVSNKNLVFLDLDDLYPNRSDWINFLNQNPLTITYVLATPIQTPIPWYDPSLTPPDENLIEFDVSETHIIWRYVGETTWRNLIALDLLKGEEGPQGPQGPQGEEGPQGLQGPQGEEGPQSSPRLFYMIVIIGLVGSVYLIIRRRD